MSTRRRSPPSSRALEMAASSRLRMDRNPQTTRINDPSLPAGRRKEIDNVMKRARAGSPGTWDRKLLEVEEKDPNRWRHTGYKQLYLDGSASPPPRTGRRSPPLNSRRTPPLVSTTTRDRPRTPPPLVSSTSRDRVTSSRNVVSPPHHQVSSSAAARREREARPKVRRPPSPPPQRKSTQSSSSSAGSCSDDDCSMCSRKAKKPRQRSRSRSFSVPRCSPQRAPPEPPRRLAPRPPPLASHLTKPLNCGNANVLPSSFSRRRAAAPGAAPVPAPSGMAPAPTRELLLARDASRKRTRDEKVLEWQQSQLIHQQQRIKAATSSAPAQPTAQAASGAQKANASSSSAAGLATAKQKDKPIPKLKTKIKKEGEKKSKRRQSSSASSSPQRAPTPISPSTIRAALCGGRYTNDDGNSNDSDNEKAARHAASQAGKLTLSERFGKMAQWSADRSANIENMRITRRDGDSNFTVSIEASESPPPRYNHEPAPIGHFPEELSAVAPGGMLSWDDVHVRYEYYKSCGYLRGLTLSDYVKWEEWWYKYQDWLKRERAFERWESSGRERRDTRRHRRGRRQGGGRRHRAHS